MTPDFTSEGQAERALRSLKDFQRATVDVVYERLFTQGQNRMLVADEVGLGKTIVAKGIIARRVQDKLSLGDPTPLRVTYICSNQIIGQENIKKLDLYPNQGSYNRSVDRLSLLALKPPSTSSSPLHLNTLTPGTSFRSSEHAGLQEERKIIYSLLMGDQGMLSDASDGLACLLRGPVQRPVQDWAEQLKEAWGPVKSARGPKSNPKIRDGLSAKYLTYIQSIPLRNADTVFTQLPGQPSLSLYEAVLEYACLLNFKNFNKYWAGSLELIRQLRKALATLCVDYLDADLYILDEFQRFRDLINEESDSEATVIAKQIFSRPNTKILLLSATPFKAFTGQTDGQSSDDHYKEFRTVLSFLLENEQGALKDYEFHRKALFGQLWNLEADEGPIDSTHRNALETLLRRVICRTERLSVSADHDAMTQDKWHDSPVQLTPGDIQNFIATDNVVQALNLSIDHKAQELQAPVEFCKSAPFPLSFMDDYRLKKLLDVKKTEPSIRKCLKANRAAWLDHRHIHNYEMVVGGDHPSFANARLTLLVEEALACQAETLLWVPPSLPYYPLSGAFANSNGFSKTLVFSAWLMVPRMLASLLSYEVERRTIGSAASVESQEKERRGYFSPAGKRRHPVPQLVYSVNRSEPANMTNFALLFPSMTLASLFDPAKAMASNQAGATLESELIKRCQKLLASPNLRQFENTDGESSRWYWAAPLLLDKLAPRFRSDLGAWLQSASLDSSHGSLGQDEEDAEDMGESRSIGKSVHWERLLQAFEAPEQIGLGPMPEDLPEVLAQMALGSPAITAFRSFQRLFQLDTVSACVLSFSVANQFLSLFNKPEAIAAIRMTVPDGIHRIPYWHKVLRYCRDGCLQAVLDEYLHLLKADFETADLAAAQLGNSISLTPANIKVDDLDTFLKDEKKDRTMRCHFAVDLGNQRLDTPNGTKRVTGIRQKFNSPFRPFVLATTSIGQEGLDFHQYCRKVVHWNLPSVLTL